MSESELDQALCNECGGSYSVFHLTGNFIFSEYCTKERKKNCFPQLSNDFFVKKHNGIHINL